MIVTTMWLSSQSTSSVPHLAVFPMACLDERVANN